MWLFSGIAAVENHTGTNSNLLMLKVISKFSAGIPPAYAADNSPNSSWAPGKVDGVWPGGYSAPMMEIRKTDVYAKWLDGLRDIRARARILARVERLAEGNAGDAEPIGEGVSELRINYGPGYRVYYKQQGRELVILLAGGDKGSQSRDIKTALRLARNL
jgi:putative addiction module killer protein